MRRYGLWMGGVCLALVALAGCANPADGKPEAVVGDAVVDSEDNDPGRTLAISADSTIGFVGSKVTGSHEGGFREFEGTITLVGDDPEASHVEFQIDTRSLWSDNERLTGHLKSADFFDVEAHPTARFRSTDITKTDTGYEVTGNLDLHGVTKSITFPATIVVGEDGVTAQAEFSIKRFDWKIEYKGKADDLIRDEVVIRFDLKAVPANA